MGAMKMSAIVSKAVAVSIVLDVALIIALNIPTMGSCLADDGYVGGLIGPAFSQSAQGVDFTLGLEAGWKPIDVVSLGIYTTTEIEGLGDHTSTTRTIVAFKPKYWVNGDDSGFTLGAILGVAVVSTTTDNGYDNYDGYYDRTTTNSSGQFVFGPSVGYNFSILPHLSVEPEVNYLFIDSSNDNPSSKSLDLLAAVSFVF
jgi:hypothetical protein